MMCHRCGERIATHMLAAGLSKPVLWCRDCVERERPTCGITGFGGVLPLTIYDLEKRA